MSLFSEKTFNKPIKTLIFCQLAVAILAGFFMPLTPAVATEPLTLYNISVTKTGESATITWRNNRDAYGKIEYGLYSGNYHWTVNTNVKKTNQAITIFGLYPETTYFFRITADDEFSEVRSFEQSFETEDGSDEKAPVISDVQVVYTTGGTATIQWRTDEPATSEVDYGRTESYGSHKSDGHRTRVHDLTITGLTDGTYYHFRVKSKDEDNNTSRWYDMTFRTKLTYISDNDDLIIYSITPSAENDIHIGETSAVITFRTNKLTHGWVRYGTSPSYGSIVSTTPPRDFFHEITLTGLNPGRTYYFEIQVKDIFNREVKTEGYSFQTRSTVADPGSLPGPVSRPGQILGASTCDVNLNTDFGFYGLYYNLSENHPDMEIGIGPWNKVGRENDWYDSQYFSLSRVDEHLDIGPFYPLNEGKTGDPNHFAVNWRAIIDVPANDNYEYLVRSDDDSWVFIDGQLTSDVGGIHPVKDHGTSIYLMKGYHTLEIYYADRNRSNANFSFRPDYRLNFHPLPEGCSIQDVLDYGSGVGGSILGASTDDDYNLGYQKGYADGLNDGNAGRSYDNQRNNNPANHSNNYNNGYRDGYDDGYNGVRRSTTSYVCNPDLGYTKFISLYKTPDSPDIWALLETGQKHYITSPESFNMYQCDWNSVKTVSQSFLNGFANTNLVRTPTDPVIYHLFQRSDHKWLKRNLPSPTVFVSYSDNYWGNVARVTYLDIQSYPDAMLIKAAASPSVYLIDGTFKRHILNEEVFERFGYDWAEVIELSQIHLDSFEDGEVVD